MVSGGTALVGYRRQVKDEWVSMEFPTTIILFRSIIFCPEMLIFSLKLNLIRKHLNIV